MTCPQILDEAETRTVDRDCPRHGQYRADEFRLSEGGKWLGGNCPKCAEEMEVRRKEAIREEEARRERMRLHALMSASGIPKRFLARTLADYRAESEGQKRALRIAQKMAESGGDGTSLIFCGKPGTGKTHLACAIALEWIRANRPAHFATVLSAIRSIKSTYGRNSEQTEAEAIQALTGVDMLILDEVGVQLGSEYELMMLFEVINERYQQCRSTILISNLTQTELTEYLGDRAIDRFRECGAVVAFDWDSYRGQK